MSASEVLNPQSLSSELLAGEPTPLGATWSEEGVNFAVYSSGAQRVELCIYDDRGLTEQQRIALPERTGEVWHGFLPAPAGRAGLVYGYRVAGLNNPSLGLRYNSHKLLIDPYARALRGSLKWQTEAMHGVEDGGVLEADSASFVPKSVVIDSAFDWGQDRSPAIPWRDTVIYELHVRGFTKLHPEVPEKIRGTYLGLAHPAVLEYLKRLGVSALELMPVQSFVPEEFLVKRGLRNYWGYNSIAWFAPAADYAVADPVMEFKAMVKAIHAAGLEVILDVVLNHTAEGSERGATLSLRGFDNPAYYKLEEDRSRYQNRTGCGNTINVGHPATRQLMIDCMKYWVEEMHVDGFRFDLAPVLGRDEGRFRDDGGFFKAVKAETSLRYVKLIAEPWDIGPDGYQLSRFPAGWSEWNDLYRDTIRGYWRGNAGVIGGLAERFAGSSDLFRNHGRRPTASVNFVTCHDGFTLYDLVAYNEKHNEANTENNQDGHNHNLSWNCGIEGATDDPLVLALRERQMRNFLATLLLSQGVPMLSAGDEFGRTQQGNNNAYCQDNELSWLDWRGAQERRSLVSFVSQLLFVRRNAPGLRRDTFLKGSQRPDAQRKDVAWLHPAGRELNEGDWNDPQARVLGILIGHSFVDLHGTANGHLLLLCNSGVQPVEFRLPAPHNGQWHGVFDTMHWSKAQMGAGVIAAESYSLQGHSCALLTDGNAPASVRSTFRSIPEAS